LRMKRIAMFFLFLLISCVLCGCQQVPEHNIVGGIDKAVNQAEQQISEIPDIIAKLDINTISTDPIKTTLTGNSGTITVDAQVDIPTTSSIYTGNLSLTDFTEKQLLEIFFGEKSQVATYQKDEGLYVVPIDPTRPVDFQSDTEDNIEQEFSYGNGELIYVNLPIYTKYNKTAEINKNELDSNDFSVDEATQQLRELLSQIGINDITIFNVDVFSTEQHEILYSIYFEPIFNGIPFVNPLTISPSLSSQIPQARAEISKEGLAFLSGNILLQVVQSEKIEKVVAIDQILDTIPDMIGSKISQNENSTIDNIELRYIVKSNALTLVWDFSFKEGQIDLVFNAETGQIEDIR